MKISKKVKRQSRMYLGYSAIVLVVFLLFMMMKVNLFKILLIIGLIMIGCLSKVYKQFTSMSIGFELVTPIVLIFAYDISLLLAILSGVFMLIASDFISGHLVGHAIAVEIVIYVVISIIAALGGGILGLPFAELAVWLVVLRNAIMWLVMVIPGFVDPIRGTLATLPNIFINGFIVSTAGVFIVNML